ncbi:MAG TPA: hypothetical protein VFZ65_11760, partial [Planctomycetota bacterium]|nr:hypothetical protein [Planctomycetota bacterium]
SLGPPSLVGSGPLTNGSSNTVTLTGAIQNANTLLVIGVLGAYAPLLGGVLVPDPLIVVPLVTNASGTVAWSFPQPGLPPGFPLRFQHWIEDGTASFGYTASNGLLGICQ